MMTHSLILALLMSTAGVMPMGYALSIIYALLNWQHHVLFHHCILLIFMRLWFDEISNVALCRAIWRAPSFSSRIHVMPLKSVTILPRMLLSFIKCYSASLSSRRMTFDIHDTVHLFLSSYYKLSGVAAISCHFIVSHIVIHSLYLYRSVYNCRYLKFDDEVSRFHFQQSKWKIKRNAR